MAIQKHPLDEPHSLYKLSGSNPIEIEKAAINARILTRKYTLQANGHKFNQQDLDTTCELCRTDTEDRARLILDCIALKEIRCREKGRDLTQSCDKSPYSDRKIQKAT